MKLSKCLPPMLVVLLLILALQPMDSMIYDLRFLIIFAALVGWFPLLGESPAVHSGAMTLATLSLLQVLQFRWPGTPWKSAWIYPEFVVVFFVSLFAFGLTPVQVYRKIRPGTAVTLGVASAYCLPTSDVYPLTFGPPFSLQLLLAVLPMLSAAYSFQKYLSGLRIWLLVMLEPLALLFFAWVVVVPFTKDATIGALIIAQYYWSEFAVPFVFAILLAAASNWTLGKVLAMFRPIGPSENPRGSAK